MNRLHKHLIVNRLDYIWKLKMKTMNIRVICDNLSHIQKYKKYFIYVKMMLFENSINKFDIVSKNWFNLSQTVSNVPDFTFSTKLWQYDLGYIDNKNKQIS